MTHGQIAGVSHRGIGILFAATFVLSFIVGTFFTYQGVSGSGNDIIFLQPTLWILSLFALYGIMSWLERGSSLWRPVALWGMLGLTWVQALVFFNFSHKVLFSAETVSIFNDIKSETSPNDVVAYLPTSRVGTPILGPSSEFSEYAITAMTGLDGYFSSETMSKFYAVPGIESGAGLEVLETADELYRLRVSDVEAYLKGNADTAVLNRLNQDHVRWIVLSNHAASNVSAQLKAWRRDAEIAVYKLGG
jgi:hypothetical protein